MSAVKAPRARNAGLNLLWMAVRAGPTSSECHLARRQQPAWAREGLCGAPMTNPAAGAGRQQMRGRLGVGGGDGHVFFRLRLFFSNKKCSL